MHRPFRHVVGLLAALALLATACGSTDTAATSTSIETGAPPSTTTSTPDPSAIEACMNDARVGLAVVGAAMAAITDEEPATIIDEAWQSMLEDDPGFAEALSALGDLDRTCGTSELLSLQVVDLADEVLPADFNDAIIWVEGIGGTVGIARTVPPERAEDSISPPGADGTEWPDQLDVSGVAECEAITEAVIAQAGSYIQAWNGLSPTAFASQRSPVDLGVDIQAARLQAARAGCDIADQAERVMVAMTSSPSSSFISRGLRLTYAEWVLSGMIKPTLSGEDVIVQPVGSPEGTLAGFAIANRAASPRTGVSVAADGTAVVEDRTLEAGENLWIPYPAAQVDDVTVEWDR